MCKKNEKQKRLSWVIGRKLSLFAYIKVADTFTLLVEAKDLGEVVSLSSSTTIVINVKDGNNHPPTIRGQTVGSF